MRYCVYRYTDLSDGIIKYVGIIHKGTLKGRHIAHKYENWYKSSEYKLEYIKVRNRSEAEALESHFISKYRTDKWYNTAKCGWGEIGFVPDGLEWIEFKT